MATLRSPRYWAKDAVYAACRAAGPRLANVRAILMYHEVGGPGGPDPALFDRQMAMLVGAFDRVVLLRDLPEALSGGGSVAVVTFDDGYADTVEAVRPVLAAHRISATFFLPSGLLGGPFRASHGERQLIGADVAAALAAEGHEVGGHTRTHARLTRLPDSEARDQITGDKHELEELLGAPVTCFAYPKGDHDERIRGLVREAGYRLAVSVREGLVRGPLDPWSLPRVLVNASMGMSQFRSKLSGGLETYERLRGRA